jgi:uncharacterized protein (TIGR03067 family)
MARSAVVLVLLYPCLIAAAADPAKPAPDPTGMGGFWKPESVVYDGAEQFADTAARRAITLVVKDGEYRVYFCKDKAKDLHVRLVTASLTADAAAKTVELTIKDGDKKGLKCHGLYEVKDGKLRICYGPVDKPRPTEFAAPAGSGFFCEVWAAEK